MTEPMTLRQLMAQTDAALVEAGMIRLAHPAPRHNRRVIAAPPVAVRVDAAALRARGLNRKQVQAAKARARRQAATQQAQADAAARRQLEAIVRAAA